MNASGVEVAGYWANGSWNELPNIYGSAYDARANTILLSGSTIYAGGYCISNTGKSGIMALGLKKAGYWIINGTTVTWTDLPNNVSSSNDSAVKALALIGDTIYAGGYCMNSNTKKEAGLWTGTSFVVCTDTTNYDSEISSLSASGSALYAGGYLTLKYQGSGETNIIKKAAFWIYPSSPIKEEIIDSEADVNEEMTSILVSGNTIYAGGYKGEDNSLIHYPQTQGGYWTFSTSGDSGVWHYSTSQAAYVYAIMIAGSEVLVAGCAAGYSLCGIPGYWSLNCGLWHQLNSKSGIATSIIAPSY